MKSASGNTETEFVTQVAFVPNTHYVFTVGKDKLLKYWDADRFEQLLSLDGHHGEVRICMMQGLS